MTKLVVVSGIDLQYVGVAATCDVQGVLVLLNMHDSWIAAAAAAHGVKGGAVLESQGAEVGCTGSRRCSRDPASYLKLKNYFIDETGNNARRGRGTRSSTSSLSVHAACDATGRTGSHTLLLLLLLSFSRSAASSLIFALHIHLSNAHIGAESRPLLRHMLKMLQFCIEGRQLTYIKAREWRKLNMLVKVLRFDNAHNNSV